MRITSSDIRKIEEKFGEFALCRDWKGNLYIRFGYWNRVNVDELQNILPKPMVVVEDTMEDDEFGTLYSYEIRYF
jgi:hypothetical protein